MRIAELGKPRVIVISGGLIVANGLGPELSLFSTSATTTTLRHCFMGWLLQVQKQAPLYFLSPGGFTTQKIPGQAGGASTRSITSRMIKATGLLSPVQKTVRNKNG
jgi:hypothetical protein